MEVIQVSQKTVQSLAELNSIPKTSLGAICRYFLQMVVAGQSSIAVGCIACVLSSYLDHVYLLVNID